MLRLDCTVRNLLLPSCVTGCVQSLLDTLRSRVIVVEGGCKALSQRPAPTLTAAIISVNRQIVDLRHRLSRTSQGATGIDDDAPSGPHAVDLLAESNSDSDSGGDVRSRGGDKPTGAGSALAAAAAMPPMLAVVDIQRAVRQCSTLVEELEEDFERQKQDIAEWTTATHAARAVLEEGYRRCDAIVVALDILTHQGAMSNASGSEKQLPAGIRPGLLSGDSGLELTVKLAMNELRESLVALDSIISKPYRQALDKSVARSGLADGSAVKRYLDATRAKLSSVERLLEAESQIANTTGQRTEEKLTEAYVLGG
jgi:hypothetical protein